MDRQAQRKALFRSKLRESSQNREKRIDSPLVRYNESDQPVCRVCNVILKSESLWPAHQASRKHHEAIENLKATAAGATQAGKVTEKLTELHKPRSSSTLPADFFDNRETKLQKTDFSSQWDIDDEYKKIIQRMTPSRVVLDNESCANATVVRINGVKGLKVYEEIFTDSELVRLAEFINKLRHAGHIRELSGKEVSPAIGLDVSESGKTMGRPVNDHLMEMDKNENKLPNKFNQPSNKMDYSEAKLMKGIFHGSSSDKKESIESRTSSKLNQAPILDNLEIKQVKKALPDGFFDGKEKSENTNLNQFREPSKKFDGLESKQVKGALPEGFFDNKDADLRARGIEPVKVDINDAYKEFEKEIHDDLQGVDDRLEEEEIDAAEIREEYESLEQRAYREKVEMVKKQLLEVKAARIARGQKSPAFKGRESSDESSSDDDNDDDDFAVDWRAKRF